MHKIVTIEHGGKLVSEPRVQNLVIVSSTLGRDVIAYSMILRDLRLHSKVKKIDGRAFSRIEKSASWYERHKVNNEMLKICQTYEINLYSHRD
jgi:hypothetical protein